MSLGVSPTTMTSDGSISRPERAPARAIAARVRSLRTDESLPYPPNRKKRPSRAREILMWAAPSMFPVTRPSSVSASTRRASKSSTPGITR